MPATTCVLSTEVKHTVYLKGEFLGLAVIAVLLQAADSELFQRKSPLHINSKTTSVMVLFTHFTLQLVL